MLHLAVRALLFKKKDHQTFVSQLPALHPLSREVAGTFSARLQFVPKGEDDRVAQPYFGAPGCRGRQKQDLPEAKHKVTEATNSCPSSKQKMIIGDSLAKVEPLPPVWPSFPIQPIISGRSWTKANERAHFGWTRGT